MGHDTPVSDQVSDNGTEHSRISVPGPGRLATGKTSSDARPRCFGTKRSSQLVEQSWSAYPQRDRKGAPSSVTHGYPPSLLCCCNECSPVEDPLWTSSKVIMRLRFSLFYDRPLFLRDLGLLTVASPQPVERSGRVADPNALATAPRSPR
jgi:hypothetical protein